jgi:hypothetical protein
MPVVRRAERSTQTRALPGVRATAAATAASEGVQTELARGRLGATRELANAEIATARARFGGEATQLGAALFAEIQERERAKANHTAMLDASNRLSDWINKRLYDPQEGAYTRKGKDALPLPEELRAEFDDVAGRIEASLASDEQRAAFAKLRSQEWQQLDLGIRRHVLGEQERYRAKELETFIANRTNAAIAASTDPRLVAVELSKAVGAIRTNAPELGFGPEAVDAQVSAVQSQVHVGVISNLLAQEKEGAARAYFEATREQIAGEKLDAVIKALDEGSTRAEAQRQADVIVQAGGTLQEQRAKAREIADPKLRDAVMQRIEHEAVVAEKAERDLRESNMRGAYDIVDRTHDVAKIPPALWQQLDGGTRSALHGYARALAKGIPVETDLPTFYDLMKRAGDDPGNFATENLLRYRHKLSEADFQQLAGLQLSIKAGNRRDAEKDLTPFQTRAQLLDATLELHGVDPAAKPGTPASKQIAQLRRMLDARVDYLQNTLGKKLSNPEIQAEIDNIFSMKFTRPGGWGNWFPGGRPFFAEEARLIDATIDDIPAEDKRLVEEALRRRGLPVTDATILDRWIEGKMRQGAGGR